jgi:Zn-dependent peptidase ImmA (M78 family)
MRVNNSYGSKERLFEMMQRVGGLESKNIITEVTKKKAILTEAVLPIDDRKEIIEEFVEFVAKKLGFEENLPDIELSDKEGHAGEMKSFGGYMPGEYSILLIITNRNLADSLRTLGHELVHYTQDLKGVLTPESGKTGSEHENEANSMAGVLLREFGQLNPKIFE